MDKTSIPMDAELVAFRAECHVKEHKTTNLYQPLLHSGPQHQKPHVVQVPKNAFVWDWRNGIMGFRDLDDPQCRISRCRCGYVFNCVYFHKGSEVGEMSAVALKLMDKQLILLENDDLEAEVRAMRILQHVGMDSALRSPHMIRWETADCAFNYYIATEYISNGSLISYMHKRFGEIRSEAHRYFGARASLVDVGKNVGKWFLKDVVLPMFHQILCALAYIHTQNVCHLDFDPYNIAVDKHHIIRLLDFGSSQLMDGRNSVGGGRDYPQIKSKPIYRSPELRKNNRDRAMYQRFLRNRPPHATFRDEQKAIPPGFHGAKSDLFSAGVVCLEMTLFGFNFVGCPGPAFVSTQNPQYRDQFYAHYAKRCTVQTCIFCAHNLPIPPFILTTIACMMEPNPANRVHDAVALAQMWKKNWDDLLKKEAEVTPPRHFTSPVQERNPPATATFATAC
ncbi:CAMK/CAMKL protein kinase [Aphanomyces invadans]|uniref:non-specific serine/threonine protein kinase n=1 Tax=Aphanomyces invadans TaxID=157072 RepID=A0A024U4E7_9STRA|nr:CAMK/CAMKL protein kinase [Aphanomyces invadans]ETW00767.1 CAMK/CAMKL protein kinase [Aphanomyces invadans]|eukprot:XP_008870902.1 CAMK/CAMKL protein kinase [Aphanomyces invadans]